MAFSSVELGGGWETYWNDLERLEVSQSKPFALSLSGYGYEGLLADAQGSNGIYVITGEVLDQGTSTGSFRLVGGSGPGLIGSLVIADSTFSVFTLPSGKTHYLARPTLALGSIATVKLDSVSIQGISTHAPTAAMSEGLLTQQVTVAMVDLLGFGGMPMESAIGQRVRIELPGLDDFMVVEAADSSDGVITVSGSLALAEDAFVVFSASDGEMYGEIALAESLYLVTSLGGGLHAVQILSAADLGRFPEDHPPEEVGPLSERPLRPEPCSGDDTIDVLVALTAPAIQRQGGIANAKRLVEATVSKARRSFALAEVSVQIRVAQPVLLGMIQPESGSIRGDLSRLVAPDDGYWDEIHQAVADDNFDIVSLWVSDSDHCGIARSPRFERLLDRSSIGYNVVRVDCLSQQSFTHELGHNLALSHEESSGHGGAWQSRARGYQDPEARFRSIMARQCRTRPCFRVPRFSDASHRHLGRPFGGPQADAATVLVETACLAAGKTRGSRAE